MIKFVAMGMVGVSMIGYVTMDQWQQNESAKQAYLKTPIEVNVTPSIAKIAHKPSLAEVLAERDSKVKSNNIKLVSGKGRITNELENARLMAGEQAEELDNDFITYNTTSYENRGVIQGGAKYWSQGCSPYCDKDGNRTSNTYDVKKVDRKFRDWKASRDFRRSLRN